MIEFMTTADLRTLRREHMASLKRLRDVLPSLKPADADRAETTMANLMQQVYVIDEELTMAGKGLRGAA
ncbi:MAG: hypothetical protein ACRERX_04230 [Pseudomonas sp.]